LQEKEDLHPKRGENRIFEKERKKRRNGKLVTIKFVCRNIENELITKI